MHRGQLVDFVARRGDIVSEYKRWFALRATFLGFLVLLCAQAWAATGGSVSGTVKDSSGGAIPKVTVIIRNLATGIQLNATTNDEGFYAFPTLDVGSYEIAIVFPGFKPYTRTGLVIDVGTKLEVNVPLEVGEQSQQVTVSDTGLHVETESSQMGEVLASTQIEGVPLNGRAFTDLLGLQPGVVPISTGAQNQIVMAGLTNTPPSGDSNPGNQSINGQKENANGFSVNGSNVEEAVNMGVAILPNLDSISEFRVLTNNFDAEHGNYMGGQIVVVTKSGTNQIHGDAFEFTRNTALDSKPFFSLTKAEFDQNQFGGTLGGPIRQNRIFWFADYQGTRTTQGIDTGIQSVPSLADRSGHESGHVGASGHASVRCNAQRLGRAIYSGRPRPHGLRRVWRRPPNRANRSCVPSWDCPTIDRSSSSPPSSRSASTRITSWRPITALSRPGRLRTGPTW